MIIVSFIPSRVSPPYRKMVRSPFKRCRKLHVIRGSHRPTPMAQLFACGSESITGTELTAPEFAQRVQPCP
jgi:hypothetical protein